MTELSSSIYATPLITDLFSDGRKDIVVSSFVHYLEVGVCEQYIQLFESLVSRGNKSIAFTPWILNIILLSYWSRCNLL
jgi:hypothetical protein